MDTCKKPRRHKQNGDPALTFAIQLGRQKRKRVDKGG